MLTKAQHCTWTENHELTANVVDADDLLYICHFSSDKTRWKKFCLRSALLSNMPDDVQVEMHNISSKFKFKPSIFPKRTFNKYMSGMRCFEALSRLGKHCQRTQSHHCRPARSTAHSNSTLSNRALMAFTFQGHSKGTRAWQNIIQSLWSKILFIKFRKMLGRYHSTNPEE